MTRDEFAECALRLTDMFNEAMKQRSGKRATLIMQGAIVSALVLIAEVQFDQGEKNEAP